MASERLIEPASPGFEPEPGSVATQQDFGRELTLVRRRAGLTVRQVARAADLPVSTAGDYFAGRHLPPAGQPDLLPRILGACGVTSPDLVGEWVAALGRARRAPGRRRAAAAGPYCGLASFQAADADWYFGREELTERLVALAAGWRKSGVPLMVVGPSGSGKSSLLRAGLIPALERGGPPGTAVGPVVLLTPGASPVNALAAALLTAAPAAAEVVEGMALPGAVIVDQFEETFTACRDADEQRAFIIALSRLAGRAIVALGMRADFYVLALRHPELARALQEHQVVIGPMTEDQIRRAIVEPARRAGLNVGDGLVELLLRDLAPRLRPGGTGALTTGAAGHEPGALPLLSHALLATWQRSSGGRLTVADYLASGGIQDAIARSAELAYASLDERDQRAARRLFLRLVRTSEDEVETRHRVPLDELGEFARPAGAAVPGDAEPDERVRADGAAAAGGVLWRFVGERLITVSEDAAEITHEALLAAWPRLRDWVDASRDSRRVLRRISAAARAWYDAGQDLAALPRGGQLAAMRDWVADPVNSGGLSLLEREFLDAAIAHERVEIDAERRRTRRLRQLVGALTVLVMATAGLTGYAFAQRQSANSARNNADSRELAIEASQLRGQDTSVAAQLSLAAYQTARNPLATASLLESSGTPAAARLIDSAGVVQAVALRADRRVLAVAGADGTLRLWNVTDRGHPAALGPPLLGPSDSPLYALAFSPEDSLLAAAGAGLSIRLWNAVNPRRPVPAGPPLTGPTSTVYSVAFSPDGRLLAAGSADKTVRLWDLAAPGQPRLVATLTGPTSYVQAVAFSPNGRLLAAGSADKTVRLWDIADPARPVPVGRPLRGPADVVSSVAFSPSGGMLAAGSEDNRVWLWNVADPARPVRRAPLTGATDWVNSVSFSPNSAIVAAGTSDGGALLWNPASGRLLSTLPCPGVVTSVAWDGMHSLITGAADGTVRLWALPSPILATAGPVNSVAYSPNGGLLAVGGLDLELWNPLIRSELGAASVPGTFVNAVAYSPDGTAIAAGYGDGTVQLWHVPGQSPASSDLAAVPTRLGPPLRATTSGVVEFVKFSPDGRLLASAGDDGTVRLWNVIDPARPVPLATLHDSGAGVFSVAFSPDGHVLAVGSGDDLTRLWDIADPARPVQLGHPLAGPSSYVYSVAFSPDGRILAVGSADKTVRLWDVADPARPVRLGGPLTGAEGYVYSVAFSPDGRTLAAGATDDTVWLWSLAHPARPALIAQLTGPAGHVYSVAFSPGGQVLAAGSADGSVRLWDTGPAAAARALCAMAGQSLTRSEWRTYVPGRAYAPPCAA